MKLDIRGSFPIPEPDQSLTERPLIAIANGRYSASVIADRKLLIRLRNRLFAYNLRE